MPEEQKRAKPTLSQYQTSLAEGMRDHPLGGGRLANADVSLISKGRQSSYSSVQSIAIRWPDRRGVVINLFEDGRMNMWSVETDEEDRIAEQGFLIRPSCGNVLEVTINVEDDAQPADRAGRGR
jgi:hypothetical protein